ncbi:MAG: hypothetical protein GX601_00320 [Anaerolineales bacterium]|nr:hypothetical protein [Anaerolineales bacterium]
MTRRKQTPFWAEPSWQRHRWPADGIRARTERGGFASNWWGQRWLETLTSFGWESRLQRGRSYARAGRVLQLDIQPGLVSARVQGTRRPPYTVQIVIRTLHTAQWERLFDALTAQALFSAQLLAGEMPVEIEQAFQAAGASLFPARNDLDIACDCPDWAVPCKHLAAVCYLLAEEFDRDPFLLFGLRGRNRAQVMDALQARRADGTPPDEQTKPFAEPETPTETPEANLATFWQRGEGVSGFQVTIAPPPVETALLKRMGLPPFTHRPDAFVGTLTLVYGAVTRRALGLAFGKEDGE